MTPELNLRERTASLKAYLDRKPGAVAEPMTASRGATPLVLRYKIMGKMFAILAVRDSENVLLKCDPQLVEILRAQYTGVGQRSHLDPRTWISVALDGDVPASEVERLASHSYDIVCETLTRKQKADLAALLSSASG